MSTTQKPTWEDLIAGRSARDRAYGVSISADAPRAGMRPVAQHAQKPARKSTLEAVEDLREACGGVGASLTAAITPALVIILGWVAKRLQRAEGAARRHFRG